MQSYKKQKYLISNKKIKSLWVYLTNQMIHHLNQMIVIYLDGKDLLLIIFKKIFMITTKTQQPELRQKNLELKILKKKKKKEKNLEEKQKEKMKIIIFIQNLLMII